MRNTPPQTLRSRWHVLTCSIYTAAVRNSLSVLLFNTLALVMITRRPTACLSKRKPCYNHWTNMLKCFSGQFGEKSQRVSFEQLFCITFQSKSGCFLERHFLPGVVGKFV